MSAFVTEDLGRGFTKDTRRRVYNVYGAADEGAARTALLAKLTADGIMTLGGMVVQNIAGDEMSVKDGDSFYKATVDWGPFEKAAPLQQGESQFNFEIAAQPIKIVVPISTTVYGEDELDNPPQLIGDQATVDPPEGCEIYEPVFSFSETHIIAASAMTLTYRNTLGKLVGKTNNATFRGWEAGEVLSQAVSGSKRGTGDWEVTFRWSCRENVVGATICGIEGVNKKGWEYLWPYYRLAANSTTLLNEVTHVIVNQVFQTAAFSGFGIGS